MMNIAISGSTGFIGSHLAEALKKQGHRIIPLGREVLQETAFPQLLETISQSHAVINLAGAPINHRWTPEYKQELIDSRIIPTQQIAKAINLTPGVRLFISASAVGYYPSSGCYDEYRQKAGDQFLSALCQAWEAEAGKVRKEIRLVITRFGVVLSPDGGAFKTLADMAVRRKVAATAGKGTQPFTWIDLNDLIRAICFLMEDPESEGVFNLVAPEQVTNAGFTRKLAQHTGVLLKLKVPAVFFQLLYGEGAEFLTQGQCVHPTRLTEAGFEFLTPTADQFLNRVYPRKPAG